MKTTWSFVSLIFILLSVPIVKADFPVEGNYIGLDSRTTEPYSQFDDSVVLVEAFTTYCESCHEQFYELSKLNEAYGDNLTIFSISVDPNIDTIDKVQQFKIESQEMFDFTATWEIGIILSGQDGDESFNQVMSIGVLPTTILLNENGDIIERWEGPTDAADISSYIDENVTLPEYNRAEILLSQLFNNDLFRFFLVLVTTGIIYLILVPKSKQNV